MIQFFCRDVGRERGSRFVTLLHSAHLTIVDMKINDFTDSSTALEDENSTIT